LIRRWYIEVLLDSIGDITETKGFEIDARVLEVEAQALSDGVVASLTAARPEDIAVALNVDFKLSGVESPPKLV
jgi:hypothetical protein